MKFLKRLILTQAVVFLLAGQAHASIWQTQILTQEFQAEGIVLGKELNKENAIRVGQARFRGSVTVSEMYDDNIYLDPESKTADMINEVNPRVFMDLPFGIDERHNFQVLYNAKLGSYLNHSKNNYQDQDVTGLLNFQLPFGYFAFRDFFNKTSDRAGTEFTTLLRRTENTGEVFLGTEFNKLANEVAYGHFSRHFNALDLNNYNYTEDVGTDTLYYQLFPKTKALLEYNYAVIDYTKDNSRDGHFNQIRAGFKGDLTGKTIGVAKFGYQNREYNDAGEKGFDHFVAEIGTYTKFSDRTQLRLTFWDTAIESIYENNNYYNNNSLQMELEQRLARNYTLICNLGIDRNLYPEVSPTANKKRRDTILNAGLALEYQAKEWIKAKVGYGFAKDFSNIDTQDYTDNQVMVSITLMI